MFNEMRPGPLCGDNATHCTECGQQNYSDVSSTQCAACNDGYETQKAGVFSGGPTDTHCVPSVDIVRRGGGRGEGVPD